MKYKNILITGGCGFVGSHLAIKLKKSYPGVKVIALDNLYRKGSELNVKRLKEKKVLFVKGDVRNKKDFDLNRKIDLIIDCAAEPSVLAGINESPEYAIHTNLFGTVNCLEVARVNKADVIFFINQQGVSHRKYQST